MNMSTRRVPVIVVEDRPIVANLSLPQTRRGWYFDLEQQAVVQTPEIYRDYEKLLSETLDGFAVLSIDLGLLLPEYLSEPEIDEVLTWAHVRVSNFPKEAKELLSGLRLVMKACENSRWRGVLVIATQNLTGYMAKELNGVLRFNGPSFEIYFDADVPDTGHVVIPRAIERFLIKFDDLNWYLSPPRVPSDKDRAYIGWFEKSYHSPINDEARYDCQNGAVRVRFPSWGGSSSCKALLETSTDEGGSSRKYFKGSPEHQRCFQASSLRDFFPDLEFDTYLESKWINFPVRPGFPFLSAIQVLFESLRMDKSRDREQSPPKLIRVSKVPLRIAIGFECSDTGDLRQRFADPNARKGQTMMALEAASCGRVDLDDVQTRSKLAPYFRNTEPFAQIYITDDFIGISWQTKIEDKRWN